MTFLCSHPCIHIKWLYAGILFILPLVACQSDEITRFEDSPVIDLMLDTAPHFVASTDIEPERWIATTRLGIPNDSLFLGSPGRMLVIDGSIYISESMIPEIVVVEVDGHISRKFGGRGQAPGEFDREVSGMEYRDSHVFVRALPRMQIFTKTFEYVDMFFAPDYLMKRFAVSTDYIFLQCPGSPENSIWLICARSTSPPYDWIPGTELLPKLDFPNQTGENSNMVTVNHDGDRVAVAYGALPYIFVYDSQFRHLQTIRFEGKEVREFEPSGFPGNIEIPDGTEAFTKIFISTIKFLDSRFLIARTATGNYIFDLSEDDYKIAKKIVFRPVSDIEERRNIYAKDFLLHEGYLYVSSTHEEYVYGYPFELN